MYVLKNAHSIPMWLYPSLYSLHSNTVVLPVCCEWENLGPGFMLPAAGGFCSCADQPRGELEGGAGEWPGAAPAAQVMMCIMGNDCYVSAPLAGHTAHWWCREPSIVKIYRDSPVQTVESIRGMQCMAEKHSWGGWSQTILIQRHE